LRDNISLLLPQIGLGTDKDDGSLGAVVLQLQIKDRIRKLDDDRRGGGAQTTKTE
jgi:hypothetical protein